MIDQPIPMKRDYRACGHQELTSLLHRGLAAAKREAQRASSAGIDTSIEPMPRMVGDTTVTFNVMVVRNG